MSTFKKDLETLVAAELAWAISNKDPERGADALAELCRMLGISIAIISSGDEKTVDEGCSFADKAVREASVDSAQMAKLVWAKREKGVRLS